MSRALPWSAARGGTCRRGPRVRVLLGLTAVLAASACTGSPSSADSAPSAPHAGNYPVAVPGAAVLATPTASPTHYQLVSAGDTVRADLGPASVLALASGPELHVPPGPPQDHAAGTLTVLLTSASGSLTVPTTDLLLLDEAQDPIPFTPDAPSVSATPGAPGTLHLSADLPAGHATLTWQPGHHPMVTWDFVVEVD